MHVMMSVSQFFSADVLPEQNIGRKMITFKSQSFKKG